MKALVANTLAISLAIFCSWPTASRGAAAKIWEGTPPRMAQEAKDWQELAKWLKEEKLHLGLLAASRRMLTYFTDLETKELAYHYIADVIDSGYPYSLLSLFVAGDLEPRTGTPFADTYYFYKAISNREMGTERWAKAYFEKISDPLFPKNLMYEAVNAYDHKDLNTAETLLKKVLSQKLPPENQALAKKAARTLARVLFEKGEYERSFEFYSTFLTKVDPITSSDWLEAAWDLYQLKRYEEALGYLYNLESKRRDGGELLEKYVLRALIYREYCATGMMESLQSSFETEYGEALRGIRRGESLTRIPELRKIFVLDSPEYREVGTILHGLSVEMHAARTVPPKLRKLTTYLYRSELKLHRARQSLYQEAMVQHGANDLVTLAENLRFLKFDVAREKFSPDTVFAEHDPLASGVVVESGPENRFQIKWAQHRDFWRDERLEYKGILKDRCAN